MTAMKVWNGSSWQTVKVNGSVGPVGPPGVGATPTGPASGGLTGTYPNPDVSRASAGGLLAAQRAWGIGSAYVAVGNSQYLQRGDGVLLAISYTPTVPAWWDIDFTCGILQKTDAAYHYAYCTLVLSPVDADGFGNESAIDTQHASVQTYVKRTVARWYKLNASTTYTCQVIFTCSGGTWQYLPRNDALFLNGRVWPQ